MPKSETRQAVGMNRGAVSLRDGRGKKRRRQAVSLAPYAALKAGPGVAQAPSLPAFLSLSRPGSAAHPPPRGRRLSGRCVAPRQAAAPRGTSSAYGAGPWSFYGAAALMPFALGGAGARAPAGCCGGRMPEGRWPGFNLAGLERASAAWRKGSPRARSSAGSV